MEVMTEMMTVGGIIAALVPLIVGCLKAKTDLIDNSNAALTSIVVGVVLTVVANLAGLMELELTTAQAILVGLGGGLAGTGGYSLMSKVNKKPKKG